MIQNSPYRWVVRIPIYLSEFLKCTFFGHQNVPSNNPKCSSMEMDCLVVCRAKLSLFPFLPKSHSILDWNLSSHHIHKCNWGGRHCNMSIFEKYKLKWRGCLHFLVQTRHGSPSHRRDLHKYFRILPNVLLCLNQVM